MSYYIACMIHDHTCRTAADLPLPAIQQSPITIRLYNIEFAVFLDQRTNDRIMLISGYTDPTTVRYKRMDRFIQRHRCIQRKRNMLDRRCTK